MIKLLEYISEKTELYGESKGRNKKPLYGFGINDASYITQTPSKGWICPHYRAWSGILRRCLSDKFKAKKKSYIGCTISQDWKFFSDYLNWSLESYVHGWELDKDILIPENKHYGPNTCAYIPCYINAMIKQKPVGKIYPLGVSLMKDNRQLTYSASCGRLSMGRIGYYDSPENAHKAWQWEKSVQMEQTLVKYSEEPFGFRTDVAEAISDRVWKLRLNHAKGIETKSL